MGCYINPENQSKESFLTHNGTLIDPSSYNWKDEQHLPVCLVDNGPFTAAAVCYDKNEMSHFTQPKDFRPKIWFKVSVEKLKEVSPIEAYL